MCSPCGVQCNAAAQFHHRVVDQEKQSRIVDEKGEDLATLVLSSAVGTVDHLCFKISVLLHESHSPPHCTGGKLSMVTGSPVAYVDLPIIELTRYGQSPLGSAFYFTIRVTVLTTERLSIWFARTS